MSKVALGRLERLMPSVNFAYLSNVKNGMIWGPRKISDCQIYVVLSGSMELQLGTKIYHLRSGDGIFYGKDSPHRLTALEDVRSCSIHFEWHKECPKPVHPAFGIISCTEDDLLKEPNSYVIDLQSHNQVVFPHKFSASGLESLFMQMVEEYKEETIGYEFALRSIMMQVIAKIVRRTLGDHRDERRNRLDPALDAIKQNPGKNWTVAQLAHLCGYHAAYFTHLFKNLMGCAPKQYLIAERIRKAKYLLLGEDSLETISQTLGYSSPHYFSRNFKEATGLSPSAFRQMAEINER